MEEAFATSLAGIESITNTPLPIEKIHFSYPAPGHREAYRRTFNCPLRFNAGENRIFIRSTALDTPISTASPNVAALVEKQCETLLSTLRKSDGFVEEVRRILINSRGNFPDSDKTAKILGLSRSTFFRRLREKNTSFQKILNEVRTEIAVKYLRKTTLSIDQISDLIGFSEPTTFRSAFKKWTGQSASRFLKNNQFQQ